MAPLFGQPLDLIFIGVGVAALLHVFRLLGVSLGGPGEVPGGVQWAPPDPLSDSDSSSAPPQDDLPGQGQPPPGADVAGVTAFSTAPRRLVVRGSRRVLWLVVFEVLAVLAMIRGTVLWDRYDKVFVLFGAIFAVMGLRQYLIRVEADQRRVAVVNLLRSFTLSWDRIEWIGTIAQAEGDRMLAVRVPQGCIRAQVTDAALAYPGGTAVRARPLAVRLHAMWELARVTPAHEGGRRVHQVPTLRRWHRWALWLGVPAVALSTFVYVIGSSPLRTNPENLLVGDCFDSRDLEQFDIEILECDQPHDAQVVAEYSLRRGDYPDQDAIMDAASQLCEREFRARVGREPGDLELHPWGQWDGEIRGYCLALSRSEVTTSLPNLIGPE